jgi:hypothetical protein
VGEGFEPLNHAENKQLTDFNDAQNAGAAVVTESLYKIVYSRCGTLIRFRTSSDLVQHRDGVALCDSPQSETKHKHADNRGEPGAPTEKKQDSANADGSNDAAPSEQRPRWSTEEPVVEAQVRDASYSRGLLEVRANVLNISSHCEKQDEQPTLPIRKHAVSSIRLDRDWQSATFLPENVSGNLCGGTIQT